ncbi:hypothetical protein BDA99DRAFT_512459 [Phascolomyces articulosus]|uniref:Ras-GEF domain-containing protein n=1 Tax=Phascolomyces articulosus TaxID=60185 RepID=A0AAD5JYA4_9FUNG|nr:hypothetical protein BDA99DRAFT_512459 [Phascolomyces articulosus]
MATTATGGLPLVPFSPLAKSTLVSKNAYAEANQKLTEAKQMNPQVSVATLRRLIEDTRVEQRKVDTYQQQMNSVQAATAFNWDPDVLARQVAAIDCQLYAKVILKKKWLCQMDKKQSKLVHLVDFHRYLTHSFAHQLIYWSELAQNTNNNASSSSNSHSYSNVIPPVHPKDNLVSHLVKVAYLLVHVYRDMNGFAAIMRALMLPEVRRLRKLWQTCPSRTREMYRELAQIMSPSKNHQAYHDLMQRKIELFHPHSSNGSTIAVPWIQPHLSEIQSIMKEYTAGDHEENYYYSRASRLGESVLSAPGARKLSMVIAVLELCQVNSTTESADLIEELSSKNSRRMSFKPVQLDGLRSTVIPPPDLNRLLPGDAVAHHWLVSRVYLTKDQLISESIEVESLKPGETLACDTEIEEEELLERDMVDTDAVLGAIPSNSRRASFTLDDDEDDDNSHHGDPVALEAPSSSIVPASVPKLERQQQMLPTLPQVPITLPVEVSEPIEQKQQEEEQQKQFKTVDEDLQNIWGSPTEEENIKTLDKEGEGVLPANGHHHHDQHKREKSLTNQSTQSGSTHQDSSATNQTKKSRLSPTAPEFVPSRKLSTSGLTDFPSSVVVSPASSIQDVRELPAPIVEEEQEQQESRQDQVVVVQEDQDDPEEEWRGYLYYEKNGETESETWRGYPSPPSESNNNSVKEEGGEGERRTSTSPSESSEEWKGYTAASAEADWQRDIDLQVQHRDWQGYTLETLNEDELDSSTMMDGEFEKSRQARRQEDPIEAFRRHQEHKNNNSNNNNNRWANKLHS